MFSSLEQHCLKEMASIVVTCKWFDRIVPGQLSSFLANSCWFGNNLRDETNNEANNEIVQ